MLWDAVRHGFLDELKKIGAVDLTGLSPETLLNQKQPQPMETLGSKKAIEILDRADALKTASATVADSAESYGRALESKGKTIRNLGYGGGLLALGSSFIPGIRNRAALRRGLRAAAVLGGIGGYGGETAMYQGRGYQAGAKALRTGKVPEDSGLYYSPSTFATTMRAGKTASVTSPGLQLRASQKVGQPVVSRAKKGPAVKQQIRGSLIGLKGALPPT